MSCSAGSMTVTRFSGQTTLISPDSSSPTGPAPTSNTRSARESSSCAAWIRSSASLVTSVSVFAGKGYPEPDARTT